MQSGKSPLRACASSDRRDLLSCRGCNVIVVAQQLAGDKSSLRAVASEVRELDRPVTIGRIRPSTSSETTVDEMAGSEDVSTGPIVIGPSSTARLGPAIELVGSASVKPSAELSRAKASRNTFQTPIRTTGGSCHPADHQHGQDPVHIPLPRASPSECEDGRAESSSSTSEGSSRTPTVDDGVGSGWASEKTSRKTSVHIDDVPTDDKIPVAVRDLPHPQVLVTEHLSAAPARPATGPTADRQKVEASSTSVGGWDLDPVAPDPTSSSWEGEGWGVPAPSQAEAQLISSLNAQRRPQPRSVSASNAVASSSQMRAPPVPIGKFNSNAWASAVRAPPFFPAPPPPAAPEPMHYYPETHNRQPTYIHAGPPAPLAVRPTRSSLGMSSTTPSSPREGLNFTPLLREIASFLPEEKPQRSSVNDKLVRRNPKFYQEERLGSWRQYAEAALKQGLVEMGSDAGGSGGGQWIRLTTWGQLRVSRG